MPLYEYRCRGCAQEFELLVRSDDVPACPACQATTLDKLMSATAVAVGRDAAPAPGPGACGTCGDPRGPGACAMR